MNPIASNVATEDGFNLSRAEFASGDEALSREWLVTNGLGGFASGTVGQANTRRYHGLLVASLRPPVDRVVMVAKLDATALHRGRRFELAANEFSDGTVAPRGFEHLSAFHLEHSTPVWTFALADALLEQRVWMANGRNTTYVSFTLRGATEPVELELVPLCTYRDYHSHTRGGWALEVASEARGCQVTAFAGAQPYRLSADRGEFSASPDWYWNFHHRAESERGLDVREDLFRPGVFRARLAAGETLTFIATAESDEPDLPRVAHTQESKRQQALLGSTPENAPLWVRQLTLAADQFIVQRWRDGKPAGTTVIAGYPWFSDWGRDTMIALPGLALATDRAADAASILRTFAVHASEGMLPNRFPDGGEAPEYNTVDATLWYFHAINAYVEATRDRQLLGDLYPTLRDIVEWHRRGTRFGIHVDPVDGLLFAGEPGVQLTWMDAKIGGWVVTPRIGKPVEINALWHFALVSMAKWADTLGDKRGAADYARDAARVAASFADAFWFAQGNYLYDVIDCPSELEGDGTAATVDADHDAHAGAGARATDHNGTSQAAPFNTRRGDTTNGRAKRTDASLRPNQIFAVSLGTGLLDDARARAVVATCARHLLTPVGLRSLAPNDPRYIGSYTGGPKERDATYHQGTVWSWLLGPFALAHHRAYGNAAHSLQLLEGMAAHLSESCLGTVSEIFDGNAPHTPRGCFAQAWSVSETLRAWHTLTRLGTRTERSRFAKGMNP
ncbi:MAG: amylo-alpha-1,6-glucosidase [Gammaproteobacteria bacterium]